MVDQTDQIGTDLSDEETMSLLKSKGHGVLSMAKDDEAYGIPISFGYDEVDDRFLFEFLNIGESKKQQFVTASEAVTLTVYTFENPETWKSAIVTGTIQSINASDIAERSVSSFSVQADDGAEQIRWEGAEQLEREWYAIQPTTITGRRR